MTQAPDLVKDDGPDVAAWNADNPLHPRAGDGTFTDRVGGALRKLADEFGQIVAHEQFGEPDSPVSSHGVATLHEDGSITVASIEDDEEHDAVLRMAHKGFPLQEFIDSIDASVEDVQADDFDGHDMQIDWGEEYAGQPLSVTYGKYRSGDRYVAVDTEGSGLGLTPEHALGFVDSLRRLQEAQDAHMSGEPTLTRPLATGESLGRRRVFGGEYGDGGLVAAPAVTAGGPRLRMGLVSSEEDAPRRWTGGRGKTTLDLDQDSAEQVAAVLEEFNATGRARQKIYDRYAEAYDDIDASGGDQADYDALSAEIRDELGGDFDDDFGRRTIATPWGTLRLTDVGMDDEANAHHRHVRVEIWPAGMSEQEYDAGNPDHADWAWPGTEWEKPTADLRASDIRGLVKLLRETFRPDGQSLNKSEGASNMDTTTYAWAPITKSVKQDDGTLMVYGPASDASLDRDGQRMNQAWLDKAMPRWMAEGGNIREQHDPKRAVGVGVGLTKDGSSGRWMLAAHVVDPIAVKKVETRVLKGYSIGIKEPRLAMGKAEAPNGEVVDGYVCEVSLADRPSNPLMLFTMVKADGAGGGLEPVENPTIVESPDAGEAEDPDAATGTKVDEPDLAKRDFSQAERDDAAKSGKAMSDGSFPIENATDLSNAIYLAGHAKDPAAARRHIISRARALGLTSQLPESWNVEKAEELLATVAALLPDLIKAEVARLVAPATQTPPVDGGSTTTDTTPDLVKAAVAEAIRAPQERAEGLANQVAQLEAKLAAMPQPGGPVLTRTAPAVRAPEIHQRQHEAAQLLAKADSVTDPVLRKGYRDRANQLLKADA